MNNLLVYIFIFILLIILMNYLNNKSTEKFNDINNKRPPGPWGDIGTGKPWYNYPYILHNIEYY